MKTEWTFRRLNQSMKDELKGLLGEEGVAVGAAVGAISGRLA